MISALPEVAGRAGFSRCGDYRYWLRRCWDPRRPQCAFIGLNPSTADARVDDPTLRRCIGFAQDWGFGSLLLVNLFSYRCTDPRQLKRVSDPIGSGTSRWIQRAERESGLVVAAWGNGGVLMHRGRNVLSKLDRPYCLGTTGQGMPRHPLYCPRDTAPLLLSQTF